MVSRGSCSAGRAVAESRHKRLVGVVTQRRAGLGSFPSRHIDITKGKEKQYLVREEVRAVVEEERTCRTMAMGQQGAWTKWPGLS